MTFDLSAVTDSLIGLVKNQWATAPIWSEIGGTGSGPTFTPTFTGLAPDAARQAPGPQLSLYLYHVESDTTRENMFWQPQMLDQPGPPIRSLPLALDLFYLLFAYSETSYAQEHEAMSVALRIYHANPIVRSASSVAVPWELTLTMEHRSYDELSRLWQATTAPLRMSVVYRAAVAFIDPDPTPPPAPNPATVSLAVGQVPPAPPAGSLAGYPAVLGTSRQSSYVGPDGTPVALLRSPATVAAGQNATLVGTAFGTSAVSDHVYLLPPTGLEVDVTGWVLAADSSPTRFVLSVPAATGAVPAGTPDPGVYQLRVGSGAIGAPSAIRSDATPLSVAAFVDPSSGPVLSGAPPYTVNGRGFLPGETEVFVGGVALSEAAGTPGSGQVSLATTGTSFAFEPPPGPAGAVLPVRVRVRGIESDPALWVRL